MRQQATAQPRRCSRAGIDPRGVDPAAPNPLLGLRFFVDRMEPAYAHLGASGSGAARDEQGRLDLEARPRAALPLVRALHAART